MPPPTLGRHIPASPRVPQVPGALPCHSPAGWRCVPAGQPRRYTGRAPASIGRGPRRVVIVKHGGAAGAGPHQRAAPAAPAAGDTHTHVRPVSGPPPPEPGHGVPPRPGQGGAEERAPAPAAAGTDRRGPSSTARTLAAAAEVVPWWGGVTLPGRRRSPAAGRQSRHVLPGPRSPLLSPLVPRVGAELSRGGRGSRRRCFIVSVSAPASAPV